MKKLSFVLTVLLTGLIVSSCEPARPGGGDIAPSSTFEGELKESPVGKADSSIEKALLKKQQEDTLK